MDSKCHSFNKELTELLSGEDKVFDFGLNYKGKNLYLRLHRENIGGNVVTKFSTHNDVQSSQKQFEGDVGQVVLNDWLISINGSAIKIDGLDFDELPKLEFIPTPV